MNLIIRTSKCASELSACRLVIPKMNLQARWFINEKKNKMTEKKQKKQFEEYYKLLLNIDKFSLVRMEDLLKVSLRRILW